MPKETGGADEVNGRNKEDIVGPKKALKDRLFSEEEAAAILGISLRMLADRRRAGRIGAIKDGYYIRYKIHHLEAYLDAHGCSALSQDMDPNALVSEIRKQLLWGLRTPLRRPRKKK
jgi:hypothetical protein